MQKNSIFLIVLLISTSLTASELNCKQQTFFNKFYANVSALGSAALAYLLLEPPPCAACLGHPKKLQLRPPTCLQNIFSPKHTLKAVRKCAKRKQLPLRYHPSRLANPRLSAITECLSADTLTPLLIPKDNESNNESAITRPQPIDESLEGARKRKQNAYKNFPSYINRNIDSIAFTFNILAKSPNVLEIFEDMGEALDSLGHNYSRFKDCVFEIPNSKTEIIDTKVSDTVLVVLQHHLNHMNDSLKDIHVRCKAKSLNVLSHEIRNRKLICNMSDERDVDLFAKYPHIVFNKYILPTRWQLYTAAHDNVKRMMLGYGLLFKYSDNEQVHELKKLIRKHTAIFEVLLTNIVDTITVLHKENPKASFLNYCKIYAILRRRHTTLLQFFYDNGLLNLNNKELETKQKELQETQKKLFSWYT